MDPFTCPPLGPPLPPGTVLAFRRTGPRRLVIPGQALFLQHERRRYRCEVLTVQHEHYRTGTGRPLIRCRFSVRILE